MHIFLNYKISPLHWVMKMLYKVTLHLPGIRQLMSTLLHMTGPREALTSDVTLRIKAMKYEPKNKINRYKKFREYTWVHIVDELIMLILTAVYQCFCFLRIPSF